MDWVPLSPGGHSGAAWRPARGYHFARGLSTVGIRVHELSHLLPHYLIAFRAIGDRFQPVVLLGPGGDSNLYVEAGGRWLASYVPEALRGYPFTLADHKEQAKVLCLHRDHLLPESGAKGALPLFDENGALAGEAQRILEFLKQREQRTAVTRAATGALQDAGLIRPRTLTLPRGSGERPLRLEGLHAVDEERLDHMDAGSFAGLRASGALLLAHAQLLTFSRTEHLERRMIHINSQSLKKQSASVTAEELFGDNDVLNFDQYE